MLPSSCQTQVRQSHVGIVTNASQYNFVYRLVIPNKFIIIIIIIFVIMCFAKSRSDRG